MGNRRVGGLIEVKVDGGQVSAKGEFTCNPGLVKREPVMGQDGFHGYKETPQVAYIDGTITDLNETDVNALFSSTDSTATVSLANGKIFVLRKAYWAGDNDVKTGEGEIPFRMEGASGEFV